MGIKEAMEHFRSGEAYYKNGQYDEAIKEFSETIDTLDPMKQGTTESYNAYLSRAHAYREKKNIDMAVPDFKMALKICPDNVLAKEFLEHALMMQSAKNQLFGSASQKRDDTDKSPRSGCYVATCVYGSYDCPEVWTLRRYRDSRLSNSWFGRLFIQVYYAVSPKIVASFGNRKWFNGLCKPVINNFVQRLLRMGIDGSPYSDM